MSRSSEDHPTTTSKRPPFSGGRLYYGWIQVWVVSFTELVSWGILYYAFSVLIVPAGRLDRRNAGVTKRGRPAWWGWQGGTSDTPRQVR